MARVTVEDCLGEVENRFQLVLVATKRARQVANGAEPGVPWENDKPTVVALREIAAGLVGASILDEMPIPEIDEEALFAEAVALEEAEEQAAAQQAETEPGPGAEATPDEPPAPPSAEDE